MALGHTRLGDVGFGVCPCHKHAVPYVTVFINSTCPQVNSEGLPEMALGSVGIASCGHATVALTGSFLNNNCGLPVHRLGDTGVNCGSYTATSGSSVTNSL